MGTRNLTVAKKNGEIKFAKYCQWDGYPSGTGEDILQALKDIGLDRVKEIIDRVRPITDEEVEHINSFNKIVEVNKGFYTKEEPEWKVKFPWASRDTNGADLLHLLNRTDDILSTFFQENFAANSLFCEWCYVIDFDTNTFEVFSGFNRSPLNESDRFYYLQNMSKDGFYPVKLEKIYSLNDLPDDLKELENNDEDQN